MVDMKQRERPHKSSTHEEMFFHIFFDSSETVKGYKGATVFCRKEDSGYWWASVALCASTDQFSRRVGRSQARRRYFRDRPANFGALVFIVEKIDYDKAKEIALEWAKPLLH